MTDRRATLIKSLSGLDLEPERIEIFVDRALTEDPKVTPAEVRKTIERAIADSPQAREAAALAALEPAKPKGRGK